VDRAKAGDEDGEVLDHFGAGEGFGCVNVGMGVKDGIRIVVEFRGPGRRRRAGRRLRPRGLVWGRRNG
jgi:hypothetical protein